MIDEKAFEAARAAWLESASDYTRLDDSIKAAILAYESAKPKEATCKESLQVRLGSRLTVEGVEAVVVPAEPTQRMQGVMAFYHIQHAGAAGEAEMSLARASYRAMLSAARDGSG